MYTSLRFVYIGWPLFINHSRPASRPTVVVKSVKAMYTKANELSNSTVRLRLTITSYARDHDLRSWCLNNMRVSEVRTLYSYSYFILFVLIQSITSYARVHDLRSWLNK